MHIRVGDIVMLASDAPYPRYGRVVQPENGDRVRVSDLQCGDPRCASEHHHADQLWHISDLVAARAYQARAGWEEGRKSSPNAPVD